jgi:3-methyladenine DNA glycosylase AlkC
MAEKVLLKDLLFNEAKVEQVAAEMRRIYPSFKENEFVRDVLGKFPELELKARIKWMAECLKKHLPVDYREAVKVILRSLPPPNNPELSDGDFGDFIHAPYAEYVARYGCTKEHLAFSLDALYQLAMRFSAEDAIRHFINAFPEETLGMILEWSKDTHYHVRRLCSEGTRPKLPWSQKIAIPFTAPIPILDNLFSDSTRFVTRSVANHINDISKIDPDFAIATLSRWKSSGKQTPEEMDFIVRHALRTLIKNGNPEALMLVGVSGKADIRVSKFTVPKKVKMNTALEFSFEIRSRGEAHIIADYILYYQNKSGKLNNRKVFKLKRVTLAKGGSVVLTKRHMLREHMTTRKLFRGRHEIEIQINGKSYGKKAFWIV